MYPVQTAANLVAYETGSCDAPDVRRLGLMILVLATLLIVAVVLPYWRALGLPLTAPWPRSSSSAAS